MKKKKITILMNCIAITVYAQDRYKNPAPYQTYQYQLQQPYTATPQPYIAYQSPQFENPISGSGESSSPIENNAKSQTTSHKLESIININKEKQQLTEINGDIAAHTAKLKQNQTKYIVINGALAAVGITNAVIEGPSYSNMTLAIGCGTSMIWTFWDRFFNAKRAKNIQNKINSWIEIEKTDLEN